MVAPETLEVNVPDIPVTVVVFTVFPVIVAPERLDVKTPETPVTLLL
jgi:hypothetical protein